MEWQRLLVPSLLQPGCGAGGDDRAWVSVRRSLCVCGSWPSSHLFGKTKQPHTLSPPLTGLIRTKLQQAFVGFFIILFYFLILHNHSLNLNL
ncbi:hypothetical protein ACRRTK_007381 [Alexandromys fortis]